LTGLAGVAQRERLGIPIRLVHRASAEPHAPLVQDSSPEGMSFPKVERCLWEDYHEHYRQHWPLEPSLVTPFGTDLSTEAQDGLAPNPLIPGGESGPGVLAAAVSLCEQGC